MTFKSDTSMRVDSSGSYLIAGVSQGFIQIRGRPAREAIEVRDILQAVALRSFLDEIIKEHSAEPVGQAAGLEGSGVKT